MRHFAIALLVLALAPAGLADHCTTYRTSAPEVDAAGAYYVDNDPCGCLFSIWVYQESNGIPGLQRHDASADASWSSLRCGGDEVVDGTCHGMIAPDTIVF